MNGTGREDVVAVIEVGEVAGGGEGGAEGVGKRLKTAGGLMGKQTAPEEVKSSDYVEQREGVESVNDQKHDFQAHEEDDEDGQEDENVEDGQKVLEVLGVYFALGLADVDGWRFSGDGETETEGEGDVYVGTGLHHSPFIRTKLTHFIHLIRLIISFITDLQ